MSLMLRRQPEKVQFMSSDCQMSGCHRMALKPVQWHWGSLRSLEDTSFSQESVGLQQQTLHVHTKGVEKRYKVLCAEHRVRQSKTQSGRNESSAVFHHPGPCGPLHGGRLAHRVHDHVTCQSPTRSHNMATGRLRRGTLKLCIMGIITTG